MKKSVYVITNRSSNMYCLLLNNQPRFILPIFKYKNSKAVENSKKYFP